MRGHNGVQSCDKIVYWIGVFEPFYNHGQIFLIYSIFVELALRGIYATGAVRANCVGFASHFKNAEAFK